MGDRGQIAIKMHGEGRVYLYTHWNGTEIPDTLKTALRRGQGRWNDCEYLARIIFCEMVRHDVDSEIGYGIGLGQHGDIEHPVPVLDCDTQMITWEAASWGGEPPERVSFVDFIKD